MDGEDLFDLAAAVSSKEEFVQFINHLNRNLINHRTEWENDDLDSFLRGLAGFANDMHGFYRNIGGNVDVEVITWRMAAQMLLAAKVYGN